MGIELLDVKDVARLLKLSRRQVWRLRSAGEIPQPIKIGNSVRWNRTDIERWLDSLKGGSR